MTAQLIATTPDTATGSKLAGEITDKKGYGRRWSFSVRHIDNLIAQGLPHLKIGERRVRIVGPRRTIGCASGLACAAADLPSHCEARHVRKQKTPGGLAIRARGSAKRF